MAGEKRRRIKLPGLTSDPQTGDGRTSGRKPGTEGTWRTAGGSELGSMAGGKSRVRWPGWLRPGKHSK